MTDYTELANVTGSDAAVIAELAETAAAHELIEISPSLAALITRDNQTVHRFELEQYAARPFRKTGRVQLADADSLIGYVTRYATDDETTLWADVDRGQIVAVLDDHEQSTNRGGDGEPGWAQHRAVLTLKPTADWLHWTKLDGKLVDQATFAEHIEDGVDAIRTPDAATMLEVAQTFTAKRNVNFLADRRLSGQTELTYEETVSAKAGQKGRLEVPEILTLGLAPFEGNDPFEVRARIRFRLNDGHLAIGYRLIRPDKVRRAAFDDVVTAVGQGISLPVMAGTPRA